MYEQAGARRRSKGRRSREQARIREQEQARLRTDFSGDDVVDGDYKEV